VLLRVLTVPAGHDRRFRVHARAERHIQLPAGERRHDPRDRITGLQHRVDEFGDLALDPRGFLGDQRLVELDELQQRREPQLRAPDAARVHRRARDPAGFLHGLVDHLRRAAQPRGQRAVQDQRLSTVRAIREHAHELVQHRIDLDVGWQVTLRERGDRAQRGHVLVDLAALRIRDRQAPHARVRGQPRLQQHARQADRRWHQDSPERAEQFAVDGDALGRQLAARLVDLAPRLQRIAQRHVLAVRQGCSRSRRPRRR
jgi:hypothetical protein